MRERKPKKSVACRLMRTQRLGFLPVDPDACWDAYKFTSRSSEGINTQYTTPIFLNFFLQRYILMNGGDPVRIILHWSKLNHPKFHLQVLRISSGVWSHGNAPCETLLWRRGSLCVTLLEWSSLDALLSGAYSRPPRPHAARAPPRRLFLLRHLDVFPDLLWPAHFFLLRTIRCLSEWSSLPAIKILPSSSPGTQLLLRRCLL